MRKVVIVDYGLGNILSVKNAFSMFEKNTLVSNDYMEIKNASHLIVPGVGSFSEGIKNLKKNNLIYLLKIILILKNQFWEFV